MFLLYRNNYVEYLSVDNNAAKSFNIKHPIYIYHFDGSNKIIFRFVYS